MYYVDEKTGFIRGRFRYWLTVFNDLLPFGTKAVARKLTVLGGDVKQMDIVVDALESITNVDEGILNITGVKPVYKSDDEDERFTPPRPVYTVNPSLSGWHGRVTCDVKVDEHGHVREVTVKNRTDESLVKSIREALMRWEYEPATINGHPSIGFAHVNVQ